MSAIPLIDNSRAVPRGTRTVHGVITLVAWVLYALLWMPLITLVAWLLGVRTTYVELYLQKHDFEPSLAAVLPLLALACATLLIGWAEWNRWRFGDRERRAAHQDVGIAQVAAALQADAKLGDRLAAAKSAVLTMDESGRPQSVRVDYPVASLPQ